MQSSMAYVVFTSAACAIISTIARVSIRAPSRFLPCGTPVVERVHASDASGAEQAVGAPGPLELACRPRDILRGRLNGSALGVFASLMKAIDDLRRHYFLVRAGLSPASVCIDWAIERLERDEENGDRNVPLLAGANTEDEARQLTQLILDSYLANGDDQLAAGKYIVDLRGAYQAGRETHDTLESKLWRLYRTLDYPDWLVMLSRNCEYATDIPAFREPFEAELTYISGLWDQVDSADEFHRLYDRAVSDQHDLAILKRPNNSVDPPPKRRRGSR